MHCEVWVFPRAHNPHGFPSNDAHAKEPRTE